MLQQQIESLKTALIAAEIIDRSTFYEIRRSTQYGKVYGGFVRQIIYLNFTLT
jgi:hypothetical protein